MAFEHSKNPPDASVFIALASMYLDGVYTFDEGKSKFHFITPPDQLELDNLLNTIAQRVVKLLEKRVWLIKDETDQEFLSIEPPEAIESIHGSSITYHIALGKYRGQLAFWYS